MSNRPGGAEASSWPGRRRDGGPKGGTGSRPVALADWPRVGPARRFAGPINHLLELRTTSNGRDTAEMPSDNLDATRQALDAWTRGDLEAMLALLHPSIEFRPSGAFPGLDDAYYGLAGWRQFWTQFRDLWEAISMEAERMIELDTRVLVLFRFHGRGRQGVEVERPYALVAGFEDGLATRIQMYAEWKDALALVGLQA